MLLAGELVAVGGTFAPWLQSGQTARNSYQVSGLAQRLLGITGTPGALLDAWPFLGLFCAASAALFLLGIRTVACWLALLGMLIAGSVAIAALRGPDLGGVHVDRTGPLITLAGAVAAVVAFVVGLVTGRVQRDRGA